LIYIKFTETNGANTYQNVHEFRFKPSVIIFSVSH